MLTVGYSTREHKPEFIEYLKKSSGFKKINVIEKINNGEKSLSQVYNEILEESTTDIVVLCHDDLYFDTNSWYHKLMKHFDKSDFGIIGVAGTTHLAETGKWWETKRRKNMTGIVNHESDGKKWTSKYSDDLNNNIRQVVIVDGLFIALDKRKIKSNFNEDFKGFHFYDIPFCFENFLKGVKVGVITNIRITHKSIGMTNDQWEENRILFVEKYKSNLPAKVPFDPNRRLKVLISCLFFREFTGSELYVFELAKNLMKLNCSVTVVSQIGGPLTDMAKKLGIKCFSFEEAPGFKLGDGKWGFETPEGIKPSTVNSLYRISEVDFDIIHIQHKPVTERILGMYPELDKICTVHSEIIGMEEPIKDETIKKYIAIRPEIKEHIVTNFEIPEENVEIIYNPVDNEKFKPSNAEVKNALLFVGTIDYLRRETILDLIDYTKENDKELWLMGDDKYNYLPSIVGQSSHVKHFKPSWDVEKLINQCNETAGIQLGRTTIESWMCGKPSWIYKVNSSGFILSKEKFDPPSDLDKYNAMNVAKKIKEEYLKIL
jgi:glycosyltransferase involved in cell wall biosynthesis